MGDFNEITRLEEKMSRDARNANQMVGFREALLDCSLQDLGFIGAEFTWSNKRDYLGLVQARLDRGVASGQWRSLFPNASVRHLVVASSDHMGLLMDTLPSHAVLQGNGRRKKLFRFEKSWLRELGCEDVIATAWGVQPIGTAMYRVSQKIKQCRVNLLQWSQSHVRATPILIDSKMNRLKEMEEQLPELYASGEVNSLRREVNMLREKEEIF